MQTTQEVLARQKLDRVIALVPQEPAGWANLGLLLLRQQELDQGAQQLAHAAALAPESAAIQRLQALAESRRGNLPEAVDALASRAGARSGRTSRPPTRSRWTPSGRAAPANDAEASDVLGELLVAAARTWRRGSSTCASSAKRGDQAALSAALAPLAEASQAWSPDAQEQLKALQAAAAENPRAAAVARRVPEERPPARARVSHAPSPRSARRATKSASRSCASCGSTNPEPQPAPADVALTFAVSAEAPARRWRRRGSAPSRSTAKAIRRWPAADRRASRSRRVRRPRAAGPRARRDRPASRPTASRPPTSTTTSGPTSASPAPAGSACCGRTTQGRFADVTAATKLPASLLRAPAYGVWAADVDTDGDLDLVLAPRDGPPVVLRNNGDGTFAPSDGRSPGVTRAARLRLGRLRRRGRARRGAARRRRAPSTCS